MSRKTRKLIWSVPLIAAVAVIGALALLVTLEPNTAQADHVDLPGSVTGLEATANSRTSIELNWDAPASDNVVGNAIGGAPTGYRIDQSDDNRVWEQLVVNTGNTLTSRTLRDNISTSTQRHYRVFAINEAGTGPVSNDPVTAFVRVADDYPAVTPSRFTLTLSVQGANQINLSWTEPTDKGGQEITGYRVIEMVPTDTPGEPNVPCDSAENCLLIEPVDQGTKRTAKGDGLNAGSTHYYRVIAINGIGNGTPSDVRGATTTQPTAPSRPGEPVAVPHPDTVGSSDSRTIDLYWTEPPSNGGHALEAIHVIEAEVRTRTSDDGATPVTWTDWTGWVTLEPTGATTLRPQGTGANAVSAVSVSRNPGILGTDVDNPGMAYNVQLSNAAHGEYKFRMRAEQDDMPADKGLNLKSAWANFNGGRAIIVPAASPTLPVDTTVEPNLPVRTNPAAIVPLMPALTAKSLDVESVRRQGIGLTWKAAVGIDMLVGPRDDDDNPETARVNDDGPSPSDYRIDFIDVSDDADISGWQLGQTRTVSLSQWQHQGLPSDAGRIYRLFPINGNVFGLADIAGATVGPANVANPDQVLNLRQTAKTTTSITMGWGSLSSATAYDLYYAPVPENGSAPASNAWILLKAGLTETSYMDSMELNPGDKRWYRIVAKNGANVVPGTGGGEALGATDEAGSPGTPIGLVAEVAKDSSFTATTDRGVLLLWDQPIDVGKDPETSYRVQRMVNGGAWETILEDTKSLDNQTPLSTHYNDEEEPEMDEMRAYRVAALSGSGAGAWSNTAYIPAQMHAASVLGDASDLMATPNADGSIALEWIPAPNATHNFVYGTDGTNSGCLGLCHGLMICTPYRQLT